MSIHAAIAAMSIADNVVVEIGFDLPMLRGRVMRQHGAAIKSLLLAGQNGIDQSGGKFVGGKNPRRFQHRGSARTVVIGAGRIMDGVHDIADAAVEMARDDDYPIGITRPSLNPQHVHEGRRCGHAVAGEILGGRLDLKTIAAAGADPGELAFHIGLGGGDAAAGGRVAGQAVAGTEAHEPGDGGVQRIRADRARDLLQKGMIRLLRGDGLHPHDRQKNRNRKISHVNPRSAPHYSCTFAFAKDARRPGIEPAAVEKTPDGR